MHPFFCFVILGMILEDVTSLKRPHFSIRSPSGLQRSSQRFLRPEQLRLYSSSASLSSPTSSTVSVTLPTPSPSTSSSSSSAIDTTRSSKLSSFVQSQTAIEAITAVKLLAEQKSIILTQAEIEKIPELLIQFLTVAENEAKERFELKGRDSKYRTFLSAYLLADCAWSTGTLQNKKIKNNNDNNQNYNQNKVKGSNDLNSKNSKYDENENGIKIDSNSNRDYYTSNFKNKNEFFLTELAIKIISNLVPQNNKIKGRDLAKVMIGFERMGLVWENIQPNEMNFILENNMINLDARGFSNVIWSLGSLYVQFDDLSVLLKVKKKIY